MNGIKNDSCKKNCYLTLCKKYHKRVNFKAKINLKILDEKNSDSPSFISINNSNISNANENNGSNISNNINNENNDKNNFNILVLHKKKKDDINY